MSPMRPRRAPHAEADSVPLSDRLRELSRDVEYLAVKERLGEPLSAEERARLDASRAAAAALVGPGGGP